MILCVFFTWVPVDVITRGQSERGNGSQQEPRAQAEQQVHWAWLMWSWSSWGSLSKGKGLGTDLRSSFRRAKHPLPSAPYPSLRQHAPYPAGLYICMAQPIVFICVAILKWFEGSECPQAVPTQNLSMFPTSLPAQMAGMWLPVYFRAAVCSYKAQHALIWRSWHKGLPFQTTSYCCVFYSLLQSLPCSSCPVRILSFSS